MERSCQSSTETAAAATTEQGACVSTCFTQLVGKFKSDSALACDDVRVVVGFYQVQPFLRCEQFTNSLSTLYAALIVDDPGAIGRGIGHLIYRGVVGHDDGCASPPYFCSKRDSLSMVARGIGDDTPLKHLAGERTDGGTCPSEFETTGYLKRLSFEPKRSPSDGI